MRRGESAAPIAALLRVWTPSDLVAGVLVLTMVFCAAWAGAFTRVDHALTDARFSLAPRAPSGDLAVVAIDTRSLQAHPGWPWSRGRYADLVERLDAAGADAIAFDLDFSAAGALGGDGALADAVRAAEAAVVTAVFRQPIEGIPGAAAEMLPNSAIRPHVTLASVAYPVSTDGLVRTLPASEAFSLGPVPGVGAVLAGATPTQDTGIDYAIDPNRLDVFSYADVAAGLVPDAAFAGRKVLVGATAIELGDEFSMPVHGLLPGVLLNALAYETLAQGRGLVRAPDALTAFLSLLCVLTCVRSKPRAELARYVVSLCGLGAGLFGLSLLAQAVFALVVPIAPALCVLVLGGLYALLTEAERRARSLFRSRMIADAQNALMTKLVAENQGGIVTLNKAGVMEICNPMACELLGLDWPAEGRSLGELVPSLRRHLATPVPPGTVRRADIDTGKDEALRHLELTISRTILPLSESRYERRRVPREITLVGIHDATPARRAAAAEREAGEAHAAASEAKSVLIATMSHELRTPLNAIIGFAELIEKELLGPVGVPDYAEYATHIGAGGQQLLGVVNDMLLATRLQSDEVQARKANVPLAEVAEEAVTAAKGRQAWKGQEVAVSVADLSGEVDQKLLTTVLTHLLDNAAKFGGDVPIRVQASERAGELRLRVEDDGPGVDLAAHSGLTDLFVQADSSLQRAADGCGMGLFLADGVARLHGGRLRLHSAPGRGFAAEIVLPMKAADVGAGSGAVPVGRLAA